MNRMARMWTLARASSAVRSANRVRPGPLPIDGSTTGRGTVVDISESGALVTTALRQRVGSHLAFTVRWHHVKLELCGFVVRCKVHQESCARLVWTDVTSYDIAVQFANVP